MKKIINICLFIVLFFSISNTVLAESTNYNINAPYYSYTYDSDKNAMQTPTPYMPIRILRGAEILGEDFQRLSDLFYDSETNRFFLTDNAANAVHVLDEEYKLVFTLKTFVNEAGESDSFQTPSSTCVRDGKMYVADTGNGRILCFDAESFALLKEYGKPSINVLDENYVYKPTKLAIDRAGRIYVIAEDINDGVILLDTEGHFVRFAATPDVKKNLWTAFLKSFMTKAQIEKLEKSVPTEYSSFLMDQEGFLYLTSSDTSVHPVTKLNSQGTDVLNYENENYPNGDNAEKYGSKSVSVFVDIAVRGSDGVYAVLDTKKGRVFVYEQEGNLLYCFGGIGSQEGTFYSPSAIEIAGDRIFVTDSFYGTVTVFQATEFGKSVESAVDSMTRGNYQTAAALWGDVIRLCPTYALANVSLARIDIQNQDYEAALKRLEGTTEYDYYAKAYEGLRIRFLEENFNWIIATICILVILIPVWQILKKRFHLRERLDKMKIIQEIRYSRHTMFHPFDGFWDLKREKRGSLAAANILTVLFIVVYAIRVQFSGYLFTGVVSEEVNTLYEIIKMVLPLGLWCISNWCFTTLMDGEGRMKDIYIATAYSLRPYIVTAIPLCLLTHCLTLDEAFIYNTLSSIVMIWMLGLIFFSMMITHDYSLSKAVIVTALTLIGICLMLFIALTFANIVQQIYDFAMELYAEFIYRTY